VRSAVLYNVEGSADRRQECSTRIRQFEASTQAMEQSNAEMRFQRLHLPADGAMRHVKFPRGRGETQMPRRFLEYRRFAIAISCDFSSQTR
jgi:hypothetical protein